MSPKVKTVRVHAVALFQIVDAYEHRNESQQRVIGTLLGSYDLAKGAVEVTNCFCVPHNENGDEVAVDLDYAKSTTELHRRVNPSELVVGWFATGPDVTLLSTLIHQYYQRETKNPPIHLTVDTTLTSRNFGMAIKAYTGTTFGVPTLTTGTMFPPCKLEIVGYDEEMVGLRLCNRTKTSETGSCQAPADLESVVEACGDMRRMLKTVLDYVEDVLANRRPADNQLGRMLMNMLQSIPRMDIEKFQEVLNGDMKDLLMVMYLTMLTKTQLSLNEKLWLL